MVTYLDAVKYNGPQPVIVEQAHLQLALVDDDHKSIVIMAGDNEYGIKLPLSELQNVVDMLAQIASDRRVDEILAPQEEG
jgi:hypothetical protein